MTLKIPGKIFIAGEYAALHGLPALTVAVHPCFTFQSSQQGPACFHPQSPAGLLNPTLEGRFIDPFHHIGGMGRSTAEFLAAATSKLNLEKFDSEYQWEVWKTYRNIQGKISNTPSGVDLLTQIRGGYCLTETQNQEIKNLEWPFESHDWVALITGNKVKTHEHLSKTLNLDWDKLKKLNQTVVEAFQNADIEEFILALNSWRQFLFQSDLEVSQTTELVEVFLETPGVQCVKGCGALGSDVLFILFEKNSSQHLEKTLQVWNPNQIIRSSDVCFEGLKLGDEYEKLSTV